MSVELRVLDHLKLTGNLVRNFACGYSNDYRLFILAETGVYILNLRGALSSPFPNLTCSKHFLQVSGFIPSANIDLDINSFHRELERKDLYETVMTNEYSANLKRMKPLEVYPLCAEWSSPGMVENTSCLLGVLTSLYSLEVYVRYIDGNEVTQYHLASNVTEEVIVEEKKTWANCTRFSISLKLEEFKKRVHKITPTAFTWSHVFKKNDRNASVIYAGHINGDVTAWRLYERSSVETEKSKLEFLGRYKTQLERITTMYWHQTSNSGGALCFGDLEGKVSAVHVTNLDQARASLDKELGFWTDPDKVTADKITVMEYDNRTYILVAKQRVLIIYGIDETGKVFDQNVRYIEEYYITGIHHIKNQILVLSLTGIFTQLSLSVKNEEIVLEEKNIPFKVDKGPYETHGFFFSKNMVLIGILMYPWELRQFSRSRSHLHMFFFCNNLLNPLELLWNNTTGSLRDYWDCFEILRLICFKDKRFPWLGIPSDLNYDSLTLLKLKTLRYIAQLSENVFEVVPHVKSYNIKPFILIHYLVEIKLVVRRLKKLLIAKQAGKELSVFQLRSIDVQNFFLKEMVLRHILPKSNVGKNFIKEITEVMEVANEITFPEMEQCIWCGEKIIGPLCIPPHAETRCSLSMMPIFLIPAYKCGFCKSLAHREMEQQEAVLFCPYCDIPMDKLAISAEKYKNKAKEYEIDSAGNIRSACYEDCSKDSIDFDDVEDNINDYIVFSDSETEDDYHLGKLYMRMGRMGLEELIKMDNGGSSGDSEAGPSKRVRKHSNSKDVCDSTDLITDS